MGRQVTKEADEVEVHRSDKICSDCSNLGLPAAIKKALGRKEISHLAKVEFKYRQPPTTDCVLCTILFASIVDPAIAQRLSHHAGVDSADDGDHIYLIPWFLVHSGLVDEAKGIFSYRSPPFLQENTRFTNRDHLYLAVAPGGFSNFYNSGRSLSSHILGEFPDELQEHIQNQGAAVVLQDGTNPKMFTPKMVSASFDFKMASAWLHYCRQHHSLLCGETSHSLVDDLRLIDCTTLTIIKANGNEPYIALSYVWSKPSGPKRNFRTRSKKSLLRARLPTVIADAITVTKALGFHYLWVDKFCIDQDNPVAKLGQIAQMKTIYENADLTIVAAAGEDETYGLPGVGPRMRPPQHTTRLDGMQIILTKQDPHCTIRKSRWSTRGWTFQEAVLSRRRLVFTEEQVYFECNAMNCFESIYIPLDKMHIEDKSHQLDYIRAGMFCRDTGDNFGKLVPDEMSLQDVLEQYWSAIKDYSSRELSCDRDSLNAFQGIIQRYSKLKTSVNAVWGLPYPAQQDERLEYFRVSLSWYHERTRNNSRPPRRRPEFPSWTWAGWAGLAMLDYVSIMERSSNSPSLSVGFGECGDDGEDLCLLNDSTPESRCRVLRAHAKAIPGSWFSCSRNTGQPPLWRFEKHDDLPAAYYPSRDCMPEEQLAQELRDGRRWRCIWVHSTVNFHWGMVLELTDTNNWTRAGMLVFGCYPKFQDLMEDVNAEWFAIE